MFVRADLLLRGERVSWYSMHALCYYWEGFRPRLDVLDLREGRVMELDLVPRLRHLDLSVSAERGCVGSYEGGCYLPCPVHATVEGAFGQCRSCAGTWIPIQECIFEPQCSGELCDSPLCRKKHVVYATFFGDIIKIGMTAGSRLEERAIEQGADAVVRLSEFPNRLAAREAEKDISKRLHLPQRVRAEQVAAEMTKNPSRSSLLDRYEDLVASKIGPLYQLLGEEPRVLDGYPGRESLMELEAPPLKSEAAGAHVGDLLAIKGRYLFYIDMMEGEVRMLPLSELPSHFLELGGEKR